MAKKKKKLSSDKELVNKELIKGDFHNSVKKETKSNHARGLPKVNVLKKEIDAEMLKNRRGFE